MIPAASTAYFCSWLQSVSWIKLTPARLATVQEVEAAAIAQTNITELTWTNFILSTYRWWTQWTINERYNPGASPEASLLLYESFISTPLTSGRRTLLLNLITSLQVTGVWDKLDRLWILAAEASDQALISLINPSYAAITPVNTPTFVVDRGYTGNGSNNYLNTNCNPATDTINYVQNNASMGVYVRVLPTPASMAEIGNDNGTTASTIIQTKYVDNFLYAQINDGASTQINYANVAGVGFQSIVRTSSVIRSGYINGSLIQTLNLTSSAVPAYPVFLLAYNLAGTAHGYSDRSIACTYIGSGDLSQSYLYSAIQTYMIAVGANF